MIKIIVNVQLHERRVAILEDGKLVELRIERSDQRRTVGNIYKGVVENIVTSLNASFIDIGLPKRAFLHVSDIARYDPFADAETEEDEDSFHQPRLRSYGSQIQKVLKKGQEVLVQIIKDPIGTKGARCATELSIPGRYIVLIPGAQNIGVSRRIRDRSERARLRKAISDLKPNGFGVIVRTIARGLSADVLAQDLENLLGVWDKIRKRAQVLPPGSLLFRDEGLIPALVRDQFSDEVEKFIIDSEKEYKKVVEYVEQVAPSLAERVELFRSSKSIFDKLAIEKQIDLMFRRSVRLPSGGEIVIDQTEALVAIDVNSGKSFRKKEYEDMILRVNLEAAEEIARQLRLRDLGGIIVVDFIDMESSENISKLEREFKEFMKRDRAHMRILPMNDFAMVIFTRKRVQQSLLSRITDECPICHGLGAIYSPSTMVANLERWLIRAKGKFKGEAMILTHPSIAEELLSDGGDRIADFKEAYAIELTVFADAAMLPNSFRLIDAKTGEDITDKF